MKSYKIFFITFLLVFKVFAEGNNTMAKKNIESNIAGVSSTAFLVLWAQYLENKKLNANLKDPKVTELVENIDYDFSQFKLTSDDLLDVASRKEIINNLIEKFVTNNPKSIVVNLGCGLSTYSENYKGALINWFDIDLSEVINLRRKFFAESSQYIMISKSVLDFSWMKEIPKDKRTLIIMEGLLPYFHENEVKKLLNKITEYFSNNELIIQAISPWSIRHKHRELKKASLNLHWGIKDGKDIVKFIPNTKLLDEFFIYNCHRDKMSFKMKLLTLLPFYRNQNMIIHLSAIQ